MIYILKEIWEELFFQNIFIILDHESDKKKFGLQIFIILLQYIPKKGFTPSNEIRVSKSMHF